MQSDVSVIIVNYNTTEHIKKCLDSISNYTKSINYEIIVVDNNSPDRSIEYFPNEFPAVKFIFRKVNDGFGAGCNFGVKNAKGKYLLFLNPDIVLKDNAIYEFFQFMEKNKNVGLCSALLTDSNGNFQYTYNYFPSVFWEFSEAITRKIPERIKELLDKLALESNRESLEVDWVIGACMFIRSELYKKLEGFDESFFLYYEDVDLEFRLSKLDFKIVVLPNIKIQHIERSSINPKNRYDVCYYNIHLSKMRYMNKHFGFFKRNFIRLLFILGMLLRLLVIVFNKKKSPYTSNQIINVLKIYLNCSSMKTIVKV
ncbi:MAG: glycosyltransferase family 2 protein [Ignavibacteria bacterium]